MSVNAKDLMELPQEQIAALNEAKQQVRVHEVEIQRLEAVGVDMTAEKVQLAAMKQQIELLITHFGPGSARRAAAATRTPGK